MFGFGAPPMPGRTLFERIDDALIKIPDHKIRHLFPLLRTLNDSNDSIFSEEGKVVREPFSCGCRGWSRGRKVDSGHNCAAVHGGQTGLPTEQTLRRLGMADDADGRAVFPWSWPLLEQLHQWLSSYLGHLGKASSHRLLQGLQQRYPWLDEYVHWQGSQVVYRCPVPRHALRLAQQHAWFATHLPGHVLLIRQGKYWEVVVPPTTSAAGKAAALDALRAWPRRVPRRRLPALKPILWRSGLPVAWIGETGRRLGTIAERALHCRWA